jgi:hypothetical protein
MFGHKGVGRWELGDGSWELGVGSWEVGLGVATPTEFGVALSGWLRQWSGFSRAATPKGFGGLEQLRKRIGLR